jgi:multicomponent Na+:H+ antiporter subunit A
MLVGLVLLAERTGTPSLSRLIELAPEGTPVTIAIILILVGALSKSAIIPFQFWLPAAMAAPTPVSAYLHAAAMVQAGIYLIARLAPGFADTPGWRPLLLSLGLLTMVVGGWRALKQFDLKLLLAYGTVSQLGFLLTVVSFGTRTAALAGVALLLSHALFKASLFLIVGVIDHATCASSAALVEKLRSWLVLPFWPLRPWREYPSRPVLSPRKQYWPAFSRARLPGQPAAGSH